MSNVKLKPPLKVSPLIKVTRWTMLLGGMYYGTKKQSFLTRFDKPLKNIRKKQAEERAAKSKKKKMKKLELPCKTFPPT